MQSDFSDWDIEANPRLVLKIMFLVWTQDSTDRRKHTRRFNLAGIVLSYDRIWFTPPKVKEQHRLSGRDWNVVVSLDQPSKDDPPHMRVGMLGQSARLRCVTNVQITGRDNFERDLTLLRMFDVEELFS
jgi:hypothetical protein